MTRSLATLLLALLLAGCATEKGIIDKGAYELDTRVIRRRRLTRV